jgi:hypothetical protein
MEEFDKIEELWQTGNKKVSSMENLNKNSLEDIIKINSQSISMKIIKLIHKTIIISIIMILVEIYNVYFYFDNIKILSFVITTILIGLMLVKYLMSIKEKVIIINSADTSIKDSVINKMKFYRKYFIILNHSIALIILLLACSFLLIEGSYNGDFRINNKLLMASILVFAYVIVYTIYNFTLSSYLKQLNVVVNIIDKDLYFKTKSQLKRIKAINTMLFITIILMIILGILVFNI